MGNIFIDVLMKTGVNAIDLSTTQA